MKLASLPKILILNINRAMFKKELNTNNLKYPETLDLSEFVDKNLYKKQLNNYEIYAVNERSGDSIQYGHYYSYIKIENKWYKFNDNSVTDETPDFCSQYVVGLYYKKI